MNQGLNNMAMAVMYHQYPKLEDYTEAMEYDDVTGAIQHARARVYYDYLTRVMTVEEMENILWYF